MSSFKHQYTYRKISYHINTKKNNRVLIWESHTESSHIIHTQNSNLVKLC